MGASSFYVFPPRWAETFLADGFVGPVPFILGVVCCNAQWIGCGFVAGTEFLLGSVSLFVALVGVP